MTLLEAPIRLHPGRSKWLAGYVLAVHLGAIVTLLPVSLPWPGKLFIAAAIVLSGIWSYRRHVSLSGDAITEVLLKADGTWIVTTGARGALPAKLAPGCLVQPWLTVLVFRLANGRYRSVLLTQDNVDSNAFRRLRVRLRYWIGN